MKSMYSMVMAAGLAFAQQHDVIVHDTVAVPAPAVGFAQPTGNVTFMRSGLPEANVKGAPYTADSVTEHVQVLADGNRITHTNKGSFARDTEGRTRRETIVNSFGRIGQTEKPIVSVFISDPVAKVNYTLDSERKVAMKMSAEGGPARWFDAAVAGPVPGARITVDRRIEARSVPGERAAFAISGTTSTLALAPATRDNVNKEDLGVKTIEGVSAKGTRTTMIVPAGAMGNERAIEVITETWFSEELKAVVLSRHSDPRSGEMTTKLLNVHLGEPSRSMFEPPADYKLEEVSSPRPMTEVIRIKEDR